MATLPSGFLIVGRQVSVVSVQVSVINIQGLSLDFVFFLPET